MAAQEGVVPKTAFCFAVSCDTRQPLWVLSCFAAATLCLLQHLEWHFLNKTCQAGDEMPVFADHSVPVSQEQLLLAPCDDFAEEGKRFPAVLKTEVQ